MLSWKYLLLLAAGTLALATWAGYRLECRVMDSAGSKPVTLQSVIRRVTAPKARTVQVDKLNELRHRAGRMEMSSREAAAAWEIVRGFTVEDVKACLEEIPAEPYRSANDTLVNMLFYRWGQLDPEAAAQLASQPPYTERFACLNSVATSWAQRDPEGALRWASKIEPGSAQTVVATAAGKVLALQDPATALDRALSEFPCSLGGVAMALAADPRNTPESRQELVRRLMELPDQKPLRMCLNRLQWRARVDPELGRSLVGEMEQLGLAEDQMARFRDSLNFLRPYEPQKTIEGVQGVDAQATAAAQKSHYRNWVTREPEKAAAWATQNQRADLVAELVKEQSMSLLRTDWQPGAVNRNGNPWIKGVTVQYETWRKLDSAAAQAWLKTMPTDLRNHLSPADATLTH